MGSPRSSALLGSMSRRRTRVVVDFAEKGSASPPELRNRDTGRSVATPPRDTRQRASRSTSLATLTNGCATRRCGPHAAALAEVASRAVDRSRTGDDATTRLVALRRHLHGAPQLVGEVEVDGALVLGDAGGHLDARAVEALPHARRAPRPPRASLARRARRRCARSRRAERARALRAMRPATSRRARRCGYSRVGDAVDVVAERVLVDEPLREDLQRDLRELPPLLRLVFVVALLGGRFPALAATSFSNWSTVPPSAEPIACIVRASSSTTRTLAATPRKLSRRRRRADAPVRRRRESRQRCAPRGPCARARRRSATCPRASGLHVATSPYESIVSASFSPSTMNTVAASFAAARSSGRRYQHAADTAAAPRAIRATLDGTSLRPCSSTSRTIVELDRASLVAG